MNNYESAVNGRVWICWNPKVVHVSDMEEHEQAVVCQVLDIQVGITQRLVVVYALNTIEQMRELWSFVEMVAQRTGPTLIGGDFNAILRSEDRFQGDSVTTADVMDFQNCLQQAALQEVRAVGAVYTWTNNQEGANRICSNIDRCFANKEWLEQYVNVVVERLEKGVSDHCPQLLKFEVDRPKQGLFKFYNVIASHEHFEQIVADGWRRQRSSNLLLDVWLKCQQLKEPLKALNTTWYKNTSERIEKMRQDLKACQQQLQQDDSYQAEEHRLLAELEKWSKIEKNIWRQKARVDWIQLGDSNTKFFHAYTKVRQNQNAIHRIERDDGVVCTGQEQIKQEIRNFYIQLMGQAAERLEMVDKWVIRRGSKISRQQQLVLIKACFTEEVKVALFSMDSHKAPGVDGFNVFFYKESWHIIGEEVTKAVQQFFETGWLPDQLNVALISLIPKCENACSVKDFRPIACCTVLYKIIAKVLANRLQCVLDTVISSSQSVFVKGMGIFDNIILSNELVKGYKRRQVSPRCMVKVDIKKAYDSVEWPFLQQMLEALDFPQRFIGWIMAYLTSVTYRVKVNGEVTTPFLQERDLGKVILYHITYLYYAWNS